MLLDKTRQGDEIEVTPQMIDAGVSVLWGLGIVDCQMESDRLAVEEIFRAMANLCVNHKTYGQQRD